MVWVIAFGELFFGDLWCVVWGYGGMRTHFSLLNPKIVSFPDAPRLVIEGLGRGSERSIFYSATYGQVSGSCRWCRCLVDGFSALMRTVLAGSLTCR